MPVDLVAVEIRLNVDGFFSNHGAMAMDEAPSMMRLAACSRPCLCIRLKWEDEADPFMRHRESEITVAESARTWATVRQRLEADVDADLSDIL